MAKSPKLCRYCFQEINPLATVCHHCSKLQTGFFTFLNYITVAEVLSFFHILRSPMVLCSTI